MEQSSLTATFLPVDDASRIAECRRAAVRIAELEGLSQQQSANAAIVATELATNLIKYARGGAMQISPLSHRSHGGVEMLAFDSGPGIANVAECMRDGYSSSATAGSGLGAVRRLSDCFDIYSQPERGTAVVAQIFADGGEPPPFRLGVMARPLAGEAVSGDAWAIRHEDQFVLLMLADGLGHGLLAADAAAAARKAFHGSKEVSSVGLIQAMHGALRGTRGAAVAVARVDFSQGIVRFAGLGNIAGVVVAPERAYSMVSQNGTAGHESRQIRDFTYPWTQDSLVVMHSDGLSSNWNLTAYGGLSRLHQSLISATLYRDFQRDRDDACVIVGRHRAKG